MNPDLLALLVQHLAKEVKKLDALAAKEDNSDAITAATLALAAITTALANVLKEIRTKGQTCQRSVSAFNGAKCNRPATHVRQGEDGPVYLCEEHGASSI